MLRSWLTGQHPAHDDLDEEIRSHLALAAQERMADGASQRAASLAALKEFGNVTLTTEAARRVWTSRWTEAARDVWRDVRYGLRILTKSPGFSLIVIAVLTVGIGLNAAVFTLFKGLALTPLAGVEDSGHLDVVLATTASGRTTGLSYPDYRYLREHDRAFTELSGSALSTVNLGRGQHGERVMAEFTTGNYFRLLGVRARLGRTLLPSDEVAPGRHPVIVLSDGLWRRAFGADPNIVGRTVFVNAQPMTVVGVVDPSFHGTIVSFDVEAFIPVMMGPQLGLAFQSFGTDGDLLTDRKVELLMVLGRLRPGVTRETADAQAAVLSSQIAAADPSVDGISHPLTVVPIWQSPYGAQTYMLPAMTVVGAMGALLLLIVCANIAGLVLVRGISRRGEIAVRLALGASRGRILRLLFIENLILAIPGAVVGLLLISRGVPLIWAAASEAAPGRMFMNLATDGVVIAFAVGASCLSALCFGFIPALHTSRVDLMSVMKEDLSPRGATRGRFRAALVVAQVSLSLLLLVGAGLVARSLDAARKADAGFDAHNVTSVSLDPAPNGYDQARGRAFYQQLLDKVRADQGIESATLASMWPMTMIDFPGQKTEIEGYSPRRDEDLTFRTSVVAPDYFRTLRIGVMAGREFDHHDDPSAPAVAVVNDTLARRFWGSAPQALGKRVRLASGEWRTIVGVARDLKYARINEAPQSYVYVPFFQSYQSSMILHTRGAAGAADIVPLINQARAHVAEIDPDLPILDARSLTSQTSASLGVFAMTAVMLAIFGVSAMGLAAMGIYGLVSYTVKQSTHDIGIRIALGADRADVVRRFLGRGLRLGIIGAAAGLAGSLAVTRLLDGVLYGVSAFDPLSFLAASAVVVGATLIATLIPAWRAARTNPMTALRHQ